MGSDEAVVRSIRCHGYADAYYDYCLGLTALLSDIASRYQDAQKFLIRIQNQDFFDAIHHTVMNPTKIAPIFKSAPSRRSCINLCLRIIRGIKSSGIDFSIRGDELNEDISRVCDIFFCAIPSQKTNIIYHQSFPY